MEYKFYNAKNANLEARNQLYPGIKTPQELYEALTHVWSIKTCAPRLRKDWSEDNMTLGQCSITAFLVQDIFGGKVYGVKLEDGGVHCYNVVLDTAFDLTSEQFGDKELDYDNKEEQNRWEHFKDVDKYQRYLLLCGELSKYLIKK